MNKDIIKELLSKLSERYNVDNYKPKLIMAIFCIFIVFIIGIILIWLGSGSFRNYYDIVSPVWSMTSLVIGFVLAVGAIVTMIICVSIIYSFAGFARYLQTALAQFYAGIRVEPLIIKLSRKIDKELFAIVKSFDQEITDETNEESGQVLFNKCLQSYNIECNDNR